MLPIAVVIAYTAVRVRVKDASTDAATISNGNKLSTEEYAPAFASPNPSCRNARQNATGTWRSQDNTDCRQKNFRRREVEEAGPCCRKAPKPGRDAISRRIEPADFIRTMTRVAYRLCAETATGNCG